MDGGQGFGGSGFGGGHRDFTVLFCLNNICQESLLFEKVIQRHPDILGNLPQ
jgi:hypothetical protein